MINYTYFMQQAVSTSNTSVQMKVTLLPRNAVVLHR